MFTRRVMKQPRMVVLIHVCLLAALIVPARAQWNPINPVTAFEKQNDGVQFTLKEGTLKLQVCSPTIVRVLYSPAATILAKKEYLVIKDSWPTAQWSVDSTDKDVTLSTQQLKVSI